MQDKILKIAKGIYDNVRVNKGRVQVVVDNVWIDFDCYSDDADAFKVLEALRSSVNKKFEWILMDSNSLAIANIYKVETGEYIFHRAFTDSKGFRAAICEAYLSTLSETKG